MAKTPPSRANLALPPPVPIPLDKLLPDPANVRRTAPPDGIEALAENIAAEGLLSNLGVRVAEGGKYFVSVGSRRLAALRLLVKQKRLAKTASVSCIILPATAGISAGLAENLMRIAMHPADAYVAFAGLAEGGLSNAEIALRFGVSELTVARRMKLGLLSPAVLEAFRQGRINDATAQAFTLAEDHKTQDRLLNSGVNLYPHEVRRKLTEGEVDDNDARARLIGPEAYEAAGGKLRRDLFSEVDGTGATFADPALLDQLVLERIEAVAQRMRGEGWQNVVASLQMPPETHRLYKEAEPVPGAFASSDASRINNLRLEQIAIVDQEESDDPDETTLTLEQQQRHAEITREIDQISDRDPIYAPELKASATMFVHLSYGGVQRWVGVLREAGGIIRPGADGKPAGSPPSKGEAEDEGKQSLSGALSLDLLAQRTVAMQAQVADRPDLALRLLVQSLILSDGFSNHHQVAKISLRPPMLQQDCPAIEDSPAFEAVRALAFSRGEQQPGKHSDLLPWLLSMSNSEVLTLLAPLVASSIYAGGQDWTKADPEHLPYQAARAAQLDMTKWWEATADSYFKRAGKMLIAEAATEAGASIGNGRKSDMALAAERAVKGNGWLPSILRCPPANDDFDYVIPPDAGSLVEAAE